MTLEVQPCGGIGFSGGVLGGLQTSSNGTEACIVGGAVVVRRDSSETVLASPGRDNKVWESTCWRGCSACCDNSIARTPDTELSHVQVLACMALSKSGKHLATGQHSTVGLAADVALWDLGCDTLAHRCSLHKVRPYEHAAEQLRGAGQTGA